MDSQVFTINPTLSISIQKGDYGRYVKVQRKHRWIALSASLWKIISEKMDSLQRNGYVLHLTKAKRLELITFEGRRYVSLVEQKPGSDFKAFINFNDDEWATLKNEMENICTALVNCTLCNNLKKPIVVKNDKRIGDSKLSKKKMLKLQEYNLTVQNQLGMMCLYCGVEMHDNCHCHAFDCEICEPQHFCPECNVISVYPAV